MQTLSQYDIPSIFRFTVVKIEGELNVEQIQWVRQLKYEQFCLRHVYEQN